MSDPKPAFPETPKPATNVASAGTITPAPAFAPAAIAATFTAPAFVTAPAAVPAFAPSLPSKPQAAATPAFTPSPAAPPRPIEPPVTPAFTATDVAKAWSAPSTPVLSAPQPVFHDPTADERREVFDHLTAALANEPSEDAEARKIMVAQARAVVMTLWKTPLNDTRAVLGYGVAAQEAVAELPNWLLTLMMGAGAQDVTPRLQRIRELVASANVDDLFVFGTGVGDRIRRMIAPPRVRLEQVLRAVEVESGAVQQALPVLKAKLDEMLSLATYEREARAIVEAHIHAGKTVLALHQKRGLTSEDFGFKMLEDRVDGLRISRMTAMTDREQIRGLRESYQRLVEGARSVVLDMVGLWKRQCVAALGVLGTTAQPRQVSAAANGLRDASTRLVQAIDAATSQRR